MIDRKHFFDTIRPIYGTLSQKQVEGLEAILNEYEQRGWIDIRWLAYILATVKHETASKMQPEKEHGGETYLKSKKYYPYYGRDLVQTTWKENYQKVKDFSGIDVITNPDLIARLSLAVKVAFTFMEKGWYTGKKLSNYFSKDKTDWLNARRIINGKDKAELIAGYAQVFLRAIKINSIT